MAGIQIMRSTFAALLSFTLCTAHARQVTYDERSFLIDGNRQLILSGSVHPARIHPGDWPRVISLAGELGLNTIQVLFMWDEVQHNASSPFVFSGSNDYAAFITLAGNAGLNVIARLGPYICGEHNNGGVPLWMRSEAACFRCSDAGWELHMATALTAMFRHVEHLLAPAGGPIIALQVENEYSGSDLAYLTWAVATARNLTTSVPWFLCHDLIDCSAVNQAGYEVLCTINGFWYDQTSPFITQPSPVWASMQHANNPTQPLFWTEDQSWFDQWGVAQFGRHTSDLLYGFARFVAYGMSAHNWYMLTGGSNWGLSAADAVSTAYAPDASIDWLLLRHEPRFSAFKAWLSTLEAVSSELLGNPIVTTPTPLAPGCEASAYGASLAFLSNTAEVYPPNSTTGNTTWCLVSFRGSTFDIPPHTVFVIRGSGGPGDPAVIVFNTSAWGDDTTLLPDSVAETSREATVAWDAYVEDFAYGAKSYITPVGLPPAEQLGLTNNAVDTMWYDQNVTVVLPGGNLSEATLNVKTCGGEYVYAFFDSVRLPSLGMADEGMNGSGLSHRRSHMFAAGAALAQPGALHHAAGDGAPTAKHVRISLFVAAMGLKAVPVSPTACKGVWSVVLHAPTADDSTKNEGVNTTLKGWTQRWVTAGDANFVYDPATSPNALPWKPVTSAWPPSYAANVWFRAYLPTPNISSFNLSESRSMELAPQIAVALSVSGLSKGVAFVNGFHLGRYNLEAGSCGGVGPGGCAGSRDGCVFFYRAGACGQPTQTLYHIPLPVLNATIGGSNLVVLFEETNAPPGAAPPPPPPPPAAQAFKFSTPMQISSASSSLEVPFARNISAVAFVTLVQHPKLD